MQIKSWNMLWQLQNVRRSVPADVLPKQVGSRIVSRRDYCNAVLAGVPMKLLHQFQSVMITAARTIADLPRFANISLSLAGLHWSRHQSQSHSNSLFWRTVASMALLQAI
jgi:hypothetical protein